MTIGQAVYRITRTNRQCVGVAIMQWPIRQKSVPPSVQIPIDKGDGIALNVTNTGSGQVNK